MHSSLYNLTQNINTMGVVREFWMSAKVFIWEGRGQGGDTLKKDGFISLSRTSTVKVSSLSLNFNLSVEGKGLCKC